MEKFQHLDKLGKGSFGDVFLVERKEDQKIFALKRVLLPNEETPSKNTANDILLVALEHPNIIKCYDTFIQNKELYIIMEYADNGDLQKRLGEAKKSHKHLAESLIWNWFAQLCLALKYLSDNKILHRDIKLQNTFLTKGGIIKLGDFGVSKKLDKTDDFSTSFVGTPYYFAPEMCTSSTFTHKSDVWMLGCLLHELCSLEKPFSGYSYLEVMNNITNKEYTKVPEHYSRTIHQLISVLLIKDPQKRPSIYNIIQLPEIMEEIKQLKAKYPEVYDSCPSVQEISSDFKLRPKYSFEENLCPVFKDQEKPLTPTGTDLQNEKKGCDPQKMISLKENSKPPIQDSSSLKKGKYHQNSLQYILQQKAKQTPSPSNAEKPLIPTTSTSLTTKEPKSLTELDSYGSIPEIEKNPQSSEEKITKAESKTANPQPLKKKLPEQLATEFNDSQRLRNTSEAKKLSYQRDISINTSLEPMYGNSNPDSNKEPAPNDYKSPNSDSNQKSPNSLPTSKVTKRNFLFSNQIFDPKSPVSPHRSVMFGHFIKERIGEEKFEKLKSLFSNSNDPMKLLEDQAKLIIDIIGEEHRECIVFLRFMISSSLTPRTVENKFSVFDQVKSPLSFKSFSTPSHQDNTPSNVSHRSNFSNPPSFSELKLKAVEMEEEKSE